MQVVKHDRVNPLTNPVSPGDIVIAKSGERYIIRDNMKCEYWLEHAASGFKLTYPVSGQIALCRQIADLANI
jgi:hypothetical protein